MRLINADELPKVKYHPLPYTHIVPSDIMGHQIDAYQRGWNDAIDAIVENADTAEPQQWIPVAERLPRLRDEKYLVSLAWGGVGVMEYKDTGFHNYGSLSPVPIEVVTAWQPLPEPWKGGCE